MKSYAKTILLRDEPGVIEAYKKAHDAIWPGVAASLKAVGVLEIRIWLVGRRMFMLLEAGDDFDIDRDLCRYVGLDPANMEWEKMTASYQERAPEAKEGEQWAAMDLMFKLTDH
jgi:L-rhamnose mutarotase